MKWTAYNDAHSRALVDAFREAIGPTLAQVAPDWMLNHIELRRDEDFVTNEQRVEIRLVIKPIGQARTVRGGDEAPVQERPALGWRAKR